MRSPIRVKRDVEFLSVSQLESVTWDTGEVQDEGRTVSVMMLLAVGRNSQREG